MLALKCFVLLAVTDLFGLLVLTWLSILPMPVCFILLIMVAMPLRGMMKRFNVRDELGL